MRHQIKITADCARIKSNRSSCRDCLDSCSQEALAIADDKGIIISPLRCDACGSCVVVCPVLAIEGELPRRKTVENRLYANGRSVPALKELLLYYQQGYQTVVVVERGSLWAQAVEHANEVLAALALTLFKLEIDPSIATESEQVVKGRRAFLRLNLLESQSQRAVITNLSISRLFDDKQFFQVLLNIDNCTLCSACLRLCPTRAIKYENRQFVIENNRCVGCRLCQDSCPEQTLHVTQQIQMKSESIYPFVGCTCSVCNEYYLALSASSSLCPTCRVKRSLNLGG